MSGPLLTVVMCVHNGERYLEEALHSILSQSFDAFECTVVDDGSTDRTPAILDAYASKDGRLKVLHQSRHGLTYSLNAGLEKSRGELIARMDADDVAHIYRFERQIAALQRDAKLVLVGSEVELISEDGISLGPRGCPLDHDEIRRRLLLGDGGALTHPAVMFRTSAIAEAGMYDERFVTAQDLDLFLRLSEVGKVQNLGDSLLRWRQHPQSVNRTRADTWKEMKRLAVEKAIGRLGARRFVEELFPHASTFEFPSEPLSLARLAECNGRSKSAVRLALQGFRSKPFGSARFLAGLTKRAFGRGFARIIQK